MYKRQEKGSRNYQKQKKKVALYHEKIKNQRKDFQHKLSHSLAEDYDAVCVENLNLKGIAGGLHFGKGIQDNGYGQFLSMLGYKLEERGKYLIKVDRYFASSKICSVCGHKKKELALSERIYPVSYTHLSGGSPLCPAPTHLSAGASDCASQLLYLQYLCGLRQASRCFRKDKGVFQWRFLS